MDSTIFTPRLKLTLIESLERDSPESKWAHEILTDEKATWWSIHGRAKSIEDTERIMKGRLSTNPTKDGKYKVIYAVHAVLEHTAHSVEDVSRSDERNEKPTEFIGLVNVASIDDGSLPLPENLTLPAEEAATTLTVEVAYMFLPKGWGKGYATESLNALLGACTQTKSYWAPYSKLYVRAIVNEGNPASLRVMEKTGMTDKGIYEWSGKAVYLAGEWRERDRLHICGKYLIG